MRGQAFWVFLLFLGMLLLVLVTEFKRAHAPLVSDVSEILVMQVVFAAAIAVGCVRIQRRLGDLQGQVEQRSLAYISRSVYTLAMFSYMAVLFLITRLNLR